MKINDKNVGGTMNIFKKIIAFFLLFAGVGSGLFFEKFETITEAATPSPTIHYTFLAEETLGSGKYVDTDIQRQSGETVKFRFSYSITDISEYEYKDVKIRIIYPDSDGFFKKDYNNNIALTNVLPGPDTEQVIAYM